MGFTDLSTITGVSDTSLKKIVTTQGTTPWHDGADDAYTTSSRQTIVAGTEYDFECNNLARHEDNFPEHITELWDTTDNVATFVEELDTPVYVARVQLNFVPTIAAAGTIELSAYVNETVPLLVDTSLINYKASDTRATALFTFYIGSETGFDLKNKGIKFTYTMSGAGEVYDRGIFIYRT